MTSALHAYGAKVRKDPSPEVRANIAVLAGSLAAKDPDLLEELANLTADTLNRAALQHSSPDDLRLVVHAIAREWDGFPEETRRKFVQSLQGKITAREPMII